MRILVTYATKHGATAEIAEKIGAVLRREGIDTDVQPVKEVINIKPYTAVILGSAVYIGHWLKEAVKFLEDNEQLLAEKDVWFFSSGPTGQGDPLELLQGWHFPKGQQEIADRIQPHEIAVFHGALDVQDLNFIEKRMIKMVEAPAGDFRDWDAIHVWAKSIAKTLKVPVP